MPTTSKMPTTASSEAAVVAGMPWSWAAGTKWVAISPLVVMPQMAKPPDSNQNVRLRDASRSTDSARAALDPVCWWGGGPGSASVAP